MRCSQGALLTRAAAGLSLAVAAIWKRGGTGYVNLDSALQDVRVFWVFVVLPFAIALGCLLACLPRVVVVNIAATVGCFIALELAARLFVPPPPPVHGEPEVQGNTAFYVPDGRLGYTLARSATVRHRRTIGGTQIYDVTYRTDAAGRRETPARGGGGRESFLLFFGDSNVFGEGLSQTETLPYYTGEVAPGYRVYNYGVPGYGPSQALALADRGGLHGEIAEEEGYAVFFVIPAHVSRVVGSSRVSSSWGRHFPYYVETRHGGPVSAGDFTHGRPLTTLAYFFWAQSALADRLGIELPLWYTERDYRLTARVLKEANRRLAEQFRLRGSVIVLAQVYDDVQRRTMDGIRNALRGEGLEYLDYTGLMNPRDPRFRLAEHDYHYSAAANRIIAQRLAADLLQTSAAVNLLPGAGAPEPTSHVAGLAAARISD